MNPRDFEKEIMKMGREVANPEDAIVYAKRRSEELEDSLRLIKEIAAMEPLEKVTEAGIDSEYALYKQRKIDAGETASSKADFKKLYRAINFYELDPNWQINHKILGLDKVTYEILEVLNDKFLLPKKMQLELCKEIYNGKTAADLVLSIPKGKFSSLNESMYRKAMNHLRMSVRKLNEPLKIFCGILLGKDGRQEGGHIQPNDVCIDTGLVYRRFVSMLPAEVTDDDVTIFFPSPFFLMQLSKDEWLRKIPMTLVLRTDVERDIAKAHFHSAAYVGAVRKNLKFITFDEMQIQSEESCMPLKKVLLFTSHITTNMANKAFDLFQSSHCTDRELLVMGSDDLIRTFTKKSLNQKTKTYEALILPRGIINCRPPKAKVLFSVKERSQSDGTSIRVTRGALTNAEDVQILTVSKQAFCIEEKLIAAPEASIRALYDEMKNPPSAARRRSEAKQIFFSPEIKISFSKTYARGKCRIEAAIQTPYFNIEEGAFTYKNRIDLSKKRVSNLNEDEVETWLRNEYPFSQVRVNGCMHDIRSVISQAYKDVYFDKEEDDFIPISLRTFWYLFGQDFEFCSPKEMDLLKDIAFSQAGELNLIDSVVDDYADALSDAYPDDSVKKLRGKLHLLSNLLEDAKDRGLCPVNVIADEFKENRSKNKVFVLLRKHFTKKTFSKLEITKLKRVLMERIEGGEDENLAVLMKLHTGLESNVICALKWEDFVITKAFGFKLYKLNLYKQVTNDGKNVCDFTSVTEIRNFPLSEQFGMFLEERQRVAKMNYPNDYKNRHIVPSEERENYSAAFPPAKVQKLCKNLMRTIGVEEDIIIVPQAGKGTKETNLNDFRGDIFKTSFLHYANIYGRMNGDEVSYLAGKEAPSTIGANYASLIMDSHQLIMAMKQERMLAFWEEDKIQVQDALRYEDKKKIYICAKGNRPVAGRLTFKVKAGSELKVKITNKKGFALICSEGGTLSE